MMHTPEQSGQKAAAIPAAKASPRQPLLVQAGPRPAGQTNGRTGWLLAALLFLTPLLAAGIIAFQVQGAGAAARDAMEAAASLHARGEYALAAQAWQQLADQGLGGKALQYNLGVAQLQAGQTEAAIGTLRAARAHWPRNAQIRLALEEAERVQRTQAAPEDAAAGEPAQLPGAIAALRERFVSRTELALGALLAWTVLAGMVVMAIAAERSRARNRAVVGAVLTGIVLLSLLVTLFA